MKVFLGFMLGVLTTFLGLALTSFILSGDYESSNYSALLVEIDQGGIVTLHTPEVGIVKGPLKGVEPVADLLQYSGVKELISKVKRDRMLFDIDDSGSIELWYNCEGDPVALNSAIIKKLIEPSSYKGSSEALDENCPSLK